MAKFQVLISNFEFWTVKIGSKTLIWSLCLPCLSEHRGLDVVVATRRADDHHRRLSAHVAELDAKFAFASPFPFPRPCTECTAEPSNPSCRSPRRCRFRPPLAAVLRFPAPQAARPRPEAPSSLHEPVRANPGSNRPLCHRPPLLLRAEALPRRRASLPNLPPLKSSRR